MMDGATPIAVESTVDGERLDLLRSVETFLGGRMRWEGRVHGAFGLIDRRFKIHSEGDLSDGVLHFRERLEFDDGVTEQRRWRLGVKEGAIWLSADGVELLEPGRLTATKLELVYRLKIAGVKFRYEDTFEISPNGVVRNAGEVKFLGASVMKIEATGARIAPSQSDALKAAGAPPT